MSTVYEYELQILEHHLDTFGHVNNATYLALYEEARWDFITKNGLGLKEIMDSKIGPVLLDLHLTFKAELTNREQIKITSVGVGMKNKFVMQLEQKIFKNNGKLASTLNLTVGVMDLAARKLILPDEKLMTALGMKDFIESTN